LEDSRAHVAIQFLGRLRNFAGAILNGVRAAAYSNVDYQYGSVRLGSKTGHFHRSYGGGSGTGTRSLTGSISIFFKDLHINGGAPTNGTLQVTVAYGTVQLNSFTYSTPGQALAAGSRVSDRGSSLAFLAMGAGGVLALRRWRVAQGPC
jgi:hypothetical protein